MRGLEATHAVDLADYPALYEFSISRPADFWRAVWTFCDIRGEIGDRIVLDFDKMPGARFFPDARLNFAENLLRRRDDTPALIFNGEGQQRRTMSHRELYAGVTRFAAALRRAGIEPGDRVAGYMPNLPETIVAALGAAAIGAVWSSCSPDFGVQGVLDRFGQIEPRVLVAADGYFYGGKVHDRAAARQSRPRGIAVRRADGDRSLRRTPRRTSTACGTAMLWEEFLGPARSARPSSSTSCRSTIRSTSSIRRAPPASPSASSTAPAAR